MGAVQKVAVREKAGRAEGSGSGSKGCLEGKRRAAELLLDIVM